MKILIICLLQFCAIAVYAQDVKTFGLQTQLEELAEKELDESELEILEEQRLFLLEHPIDINHCSKEELIQCGLFNEIHVNAILNHRDRFGNFICIEELQVIEGFTESFLRTIQNYIVTNQPLLDDRFRIRSVLKNMHSEILFRTQRIIEEQSGYSRLDGSSAYMGDPNKLYGRYRITNGNYLSAGFTFEKDAGEKIEFSNRQVGFDFFSGHLYLRPNTFIKAIALGDYRLQFGQGLIVWAGPSFGKSAEVMNLKRIGGGIRPFTSAAEFGFYRGAAISLGSAFWQLDCWASVNRIDASISDTNSFYQSQIETILQSGLHRTSSELLNRKREQKKDFGIHFSFLFHQWKLEFTSQITTFSNEISKNDKPYNQFEPYGKRFFNSSISYSRQYRNFNFFGETAIDKAGNISTLNGFLLMPDSKFSISLLNRHYPRENFSMNGDPFRENTRTANEDGTFVGVQWNFKRTLKLSGYVDFYRFQWLKYGIDAPSNGKEWLLQFVSTPSRTTELYFRIRCRMNVVSTDIDAAPIDVQASTHSYNLRFNARWKVGTSLFLQSRVELVSSDLFASNSGQGNYIAQDFSYKPIGKPYQFSTRIAFYNSSSYDYRIYAYEQNVPGAAGIPSFSGNGIRYYFLLRLRINKAMDVWARFGRSVYFDDEIIGSGNDEINGDRKSDVSLQLRVKF